MELQPGVRITHRGEVCFDDGDAIGQASGRHLNEFKAVLTLNRYLHLLEVAPLAGQDPLLPEFSCAPAARDNG
jgi:hypothetical protein